MPRMRKGARTRLANLGDYAVKMSKRHSNVIRIHSELDETFKESITHETLELASPPSSGPSDHLHWLVLEESNHEMPENESKLRTSTEKLQSGLKTSIAQYQSRNRKCRYTPLNPAPRTRRHRAQKLREKTAALLKAGYRPITDFFPQTRCSSQLSQSPAPIDIEDLEREASDCVSVISGIQCRKEEEEEEEGITGTGEIWGSKTASGEDPEDSFSVETNRQPSTPARKVLFTPFKRG